KQFKSECISGTHPLFDQLQQEMDEYFNQKRKVFDVPIELNGTEFQNKVWTALLDIPFGQTRSYHDQAVMINNPKAIRAVGTANGDNRIAIIVPCHRVIGKDGKLTGYGGGLWRKQYLLNLEQGLIDLFE
ncbi:MAG: methylated-DNA--[protein]-cysteine S-methyltransferase, partial [Calditrichaeota bacterium]|nr:methylated-DNA--[protein]-cysteine S-methyltransferase [Calditrichota bacterium]